MAKRRVVILGGGFGGAYCAKVLQANVPEEVEVVILDRQNYFLFTPLLIEAGVGDLQPSHAVVAIRNFLRRKTRFIMADVTAVDIEARTVCYRIAGEEEDTCTLSYDHLVLALGTVTLTPPVPGVKEFAYEIKTLGQAITLRDRMVKLLEHASAIDDETRRRRLLSMVVVGGSFTGVEAAGEFEEYLRSACRHYPRLDPKEVKVTIVDRSDRMLKVLSEKLSDYSTRHLRDRGIDVRLNVSVREIFQDHVILTDDTRIDADTVVWAAGIQQNPLVLTLGLPSDKRGYLICDEFGRIKDHPHIWGIGDGAINPDPQGRGYPATAQSAQQEGKLIGRNIANVLHGGKPGPVHFSFVGQMAAFGRHDAIAEVFGLKITGFLAWWLWRTTYLSKMPGLGRKIRVAMDWTADLLTRRDYVQLGVHRGKNEDVIQDEAMLDNRPNVPEGEPTTREEESAAK